MKNLDKLMEGRVINKSPLKAFSLIELSIVILIIGILIAGITQSSSLWSKFRLQTMQNLTRNSPVVSIKDLALWYETTLPESIISSEAVDGNNVSTWYDINPQSSVKYNASKAYFDSLPGSQYISSNSGGVIPAPPCAGFPTYVANGLNNLPIIRFNGTNACMGFNGNAVFVNTNFTVFAVGTTPNPTTTGFDVFLGGVQAPPVSTNFYFGRRQSNLSWFWFYGTSTYNQYALIRNILNPNIHTGLFSQTDGQKYWLNGGSGNPPSGAICTSDSCKTPLTNYAGAAIARFLAAYSTIDIAEIIVFQRALSIEERQSVEAYLSKKYAIKLNP